MSLWISHMRQFQMLHAIWHPVKYFSIICFIVVAVDFFLFALAFRYFIFIFIHFYLRTLSYISSLGSTFYLALGVFSYIIFILCSRNLYYIVYIYTHIGEAERTRDRGENTQCWHWIGATTTTATYARGTEQRAREIFGVSVVDVRIFHYELLLPWIHFLYY